MTITGRLLDDLALEHKEDGQRRSAGARWKLGGNGLEQQTSDDDDDHGTLEHASQPSFVRPFIHIEIPAGMPESGNRRTEIPAGVPDSGDRRAEIPAGTPEREERPAEIPAGMPESGDRRTEIPAGMPESGDRCAEIPAGMLESGDRRAEIPDGAGWQGASLDRIRAVEGTVLIHRPVLFIRPVRRYPRPFIHRRD